MTTFDYTSRDYSSIQSDLLDRAANILPEWTSRDPSDFGMVMVDLWAYMGDVLHYYVDRAAGESNLSTATQRESVLAIANLLDYIPTGRTPATSSVTIDASASSATNAAPIILPKYWRFVANPKVTGASEVIFTLDAAVAITQSLTTTYTDPATGTIYPAVAKTSPFTVNVTEGERYEEVYTSTGIASQSVVLGNTGIVTSSIEVFITEGTSGAYVAYSQVDRLLEATSSQRVFLVDLDALDKAHITFGNGVNGAIPLPNTTIKVTYRRSRGRAGNLPALSITDFDSSILLNGTSLAGITVTGNTSATVGGSDSESMDSLKVNIPLSFRAQDRAVSLADYKDLTLRVPGISKATSILSGTVQIYAVTPQGDYASRLTSANTITLNTDVSAAITAYLLPRSIVGITYAVQASVSLSAVAITINRLRVLDGYIQENVKADVFTAIKDLFSFDNVSFGMQIPLGTLYRTILDVKGVDYATIGQFTKTTTPDTIDTLTSGGVVYFEGVTVDNNKLPYIPFDGTLAITAISGGIVGSTGL